MFYFAFFPLFGAYSGRPMVGVAPLPPGYATAFVIQDSLWVWVRIPSVVVFVYSQLIQLLALLSYNMFILDTEAESPFQGTAC